MNYKNKLKNGGGCKPVLSGHCGAVQDKLRGTNPGLRYKHGTPFSILLAKGTSDEGVFTVHWVGRLPGWGGNEGWRSGKTEDQVSSILSMQSFVVSTHLHSSHFGRGT
jgi:hypothetical protein